MAFSRQNHIFSRALETAIITAAFATILLLLPSAIRIADKSDEEITLPAAFAQFNNSTDENMNTNISRAQNTTSTNSLLLRGLIGGMLPTQDTNITRSNGSAIQDGGSGDDDYYTIAGRWRMFVNESLVQRFVANITVASVDGNEYHNILIENVGRDQEFVANTSQIMVQIYRDSSTSPSTIVPITLELRNKVLRIADLDIDERIIEEEKDNQQQLQDVLRIIHRQSIYGIVQFQERG